MGTNVYKDYTPPASEGGLFHKFEDGVTYTMRLASEPVVFNTEFVAPNGESNISTKYAWVAWNVETKQAQILQLPVTAYRQIAAFVRDDEYGDPTKYSLKITRTGTSVETKYQVLPGRVVNELSEVDADAPEATKAIDLIEKVRSGKGVSNVNWLADVVNAGKPQADNKAVAEAMRDKNAVTDDQPLDLSEIPF